MVAEALLAGAWAMGVVEGGSVLTHATTNKKSIVVKPELIVPAIIYGTLSLPLSLIGASPGPSIISKLPFLTKDANFKKIEESSILQVEKTDSNSGKVKRRVDLIRKDNRKYLTQPMPMSKTQEVQVSNISRYIATLEGRPLPTPLAEAMRRSRFLLVGTSLITMILMRQTQYEQLRKQKENARKLLQQGGKDEEAIQSFIARSTSGAVVRLCNSWKHIPIKTSHTPQRFAIIPMLHPSIPLSSKPITPYWDHGNIPSEWEKTPISSNWLMRTKNDNIFVVEVDATPPSMKDYFENSLTSQETLNLSRAALISQTLVSTAVEKQIISSSSQAVQVVLGTRARSPLKSRENQIYIDASNGVQFQIQTVLENMAEDAEADFLKARDMVRTRDETNDEGAECVDPSQLKEMSKDILKPILPVRYVQFVLLQVITLVDSVGSTIRQATSSTVDYLQKKYDKCVHTHRVVHVLSDEQLFIQFLQQCLRGWHIVWYDSNKAGDVDQYIKTETPITVICCSNDDVTKAFAKIVTMGKPQLLLIFQQLQIDNNNKIEYTSNGVSNLSIQEVHNNIFSQVRKLLVEGKTTGEVQEELDLIQSDRQKSHLRS